MTDHPLRSDYEWMGGYRQTAAMIGHQGRAKDEVVKVAVQIVRLFSMGPEQQVLEQWACTASCHAMLFGTTS